MALEIHACWLFASLCASPLFVIEDLLRILVGTAAVSVTRMTRSGVSPFIVIGTLFLLCILVGRVSRT